MNQTLSCTVWAHQDLNLGPPDYESGIYAFVLFYFIKEYKYISHITLIIIVYLLFCKRKQQWPFCLFLNLLGKLLGKF